jgi:hypothetical protein
MVNALLAAMVSIIMEEIVSALKVKFGMLRHVSVFVLKEAISMEYHAYNAKISTDI